MAHRFGISICKYFRLVTSKSTFVNNVANARFIATGNNAYQRYFTREHEWIEVVDDVGIVGITDHAQSALGELVYVELPEVEGEFEVDEVVGTVESVKAASDVMTPVSGRITEINEKLAENPSLINKDAEDGAWMFKITLKDRSELENLMDADGYKKLLEESEQ